MGDGRSVSGYLLSRPGAKARQIGPCIADASSGPQLFPDAARRYSGEQVFIDVPAGNPAATDLAISFGLTVVAYALIVATMGTEYHAIRLAAEPAPDLKGLLPS